MAKKRRDVWWCIASGKMLLPFTARATRKQAVFDRTESQGYVAYKLPAYERVVKITVTEIVAVAGRASERRREGVK